MTTIPTREQLKRMFSKEKIKDFLKLGGKTMLGYDDASKTIYEEFTKIDSKYDISKLMDYTPLNTDLNLKKYEYTAPTDSEIENTAKESLKNYLDSGKSSIENSYQDSLSSILEKENKVKTSGENTKNELANDFEVAKKSATNKLVKNGLANSTIIVSQKEAFDKNKLEEFSKIDSELTSTLNSLTSQKLLLEVQKQNALNSFDIAYAVKISDKIASLNSEVQKNVDKVTKLNNQIEQEEAEYALNQEKENLKRQKEAYELSKDYTENSVAFEKIKQEEKFKIALDYINTLTKANAYSFVEQNDKLKNNLGSYYTKLRAAISARSE
ncbi:MAG: hypothetical protein WCR30_02910 [Clostridia bacterium]